MKRLLLIWLAIAASLRGEVIITSVPSLSPSKSSPVFEIRKDSLDAPIKVFIVHGGWMPFKWENSEFTNPPFRFQGYSSRANATAVVSVRPLKDGSLLEASTDIGELTFVLMTDEAFDDIETFKEEKNESDPKLKIDSAGLRRAVGGGEVWLRGRKISFQGDGVWRVDELEDGGCKIRISGQNLSIQIKPAP